MNPNMTRGQRSLCAWSASWRCHDQRGADQLFGSYGFKVVVLITPKNGQNCHSRASSEFQASRHADAAEFIGSLDNTLGEIIWGACCEHWLFRNRNFVPILRTLFSPNLVFASCES